MSRSKRAAEEEQELNLAPIMNMVVILIPLLLLSAVFVEVSVINITAPKLSVGPPSNEPPPDEKPLNLTVTIGAKGFFIAAEGGNLPPVGSCAQGGPTICFKSDKSTVDVTSKFSEARSAMANGASMDEGEKIVRQGLAAYDWRELYNQLVKIKKQFPKETIINVSADPEIPYYAVVRLMDISRYQLEKDEYGTDDEFWGALPKKKDDKSYTDLFNDPVLSIVQ